MNLVGSIAASLLGMFLADARLTGATLALVAAVAGLILWLRIDPILGGGILIVGSLAIVVEIGNSGGKAPATVMKQVAR